MDERVREIEDIGKWPVLFPLNKTKGELADIVIKANKDIALLLSKIKELEERQRWIDEVARPTHPDDERPWCAAYLDCRERIKELEKEKPDRSDEMRDHPNPLCRP